MKTKNKTPLRQCTGCREMKSKKEMIRVLRTPENEIVLDATGRKNGRGAYVCLSQECLEKAVKTRGLERSQKTAKSTDFMKRAMAECDSLSVSQLSKAALSGMDAICEYLRGTAYAEGADALAESPSAFERWCDNRIIQTISPEKYHAFTIGPVIAYVIARQNEIKTVRIILSGKQNELPDDSIRERVREMYV